MPKSTILSPPLFRRQVTPRLSSRLMDQNPHQGNLGFSAYLLVFWDAKSSSGRHVYVRGNSHSGEVQTETQSVCCEVSSPALGYKLLAPLHSTGLRDIRFIPCKVCFLTGSPTQSSPSYRIVSVTCLFHSSILARKKNG